MDKIKFQTTEEIYRDLISSNPNFRGLEAEMNAEVFDCLNCGCSYDYKYLASNHSVGKCPNCNELLEAK